MRSTIIASVSLLALLISTGAAHSQSAGTIDCAGGDAVINGDNRHVTIQGACRSLSVHGNANQVQAELAPRARVDVQGDGNHIRYRLVGGTEDARVAVQGQQDVVGPDAAPVAGEAAPASKQPLLLDAGTAPEGNCTDRDVTISANDTSYTLHGGCRSVTVTGSRTTVHAEMQPQSRISIPGPDDRVFWFLKGSGAPPTTDVTGANSQTSQQAALGSVIAPPSAGPIATGDQPPLVLAGGAGVVQDQCAGRDVQINGDNTTFVLRDRCRTIEVNGSGDKIEAELLGGSRVKIVGDNSIVQFVLTGAGADPIVSVSGDKSKAYRIQRLGATSRADASRGATPTATGMRVQGGAGASVTEMNAVPQPTGK
jgi:acid stress-induced BolA-like protein IbaG/YrbA